MRADALCGANGVRTAATAASLYVVDSSSRRGRALDLDVGFALRQVREGRNLSLRHVASAVGISASLLSQVETGKTQPSVTTLMALASHLEISLDQLLRAKRAAATSRSPSGANHRGIPSLSAPRVSDNVVQRHKDNPIIELEGGITWERLSVGSTSLADPLIVTYQPGAHSVGEELRRHAGLEYGVLLEGRLTLRLDSQIYEIAAGDSFCFSSARPHLYVNYSDHPARGIWFVIGRRDAFHASISDVGSGVRQSGVYGSR